MVRSSRSGREQTRSNNCTYGKLRREVAQSDLSEGASPRNGARQGEDMYVGRPSPFHHQLLDSGEAPDPVTLFRVTLGAVDRQCMSISSIQVRSQDPETSSINRGVPNAG